MRLAIGSVAVAVFLAAPASAAELNPRLLVLRQADLPAAGFFPVRNQTGIRTNAAIAKTGPGYGGQAERSGRLTGHIRTWFKPDADDPREIASRADLCRDAAGAHSWFSWLHTSFRQSNATLGPNRYVRGRVALGAEAWVYSGASPRLHVFLSWRHGRAVARIDTVGLTVRETLALARVQQRRIAKALR